MENNKSLMTQVADLLLDSGASEREAARLVRRILLQRALERTGGNVCHAARLLRMHRNTVYYEIEELGLQDLLWQIRKQRPIRESQMKLWRHLQRLSNSAFRSKVA